MPVALYLISITALLAASVAGLLIAGHKASELRERDLTVEPSGERQHQLLGCCVERAAHSVSSGWLSVGLGHLVIYGWALTALCAHDAAGEPMMPSLLAVLGVAASFAIIVFVRKVLDKTEQFIRQYGEILDGKEPDWASRIATPRHTS